MPLRPGSSESVIGRNIAEMRRAGYPEREAVAAAMSNADRHPRARGGFSPSMGAIDAALELARHPAPAAPKHAERHSPKDAKSPGIPFAGGLIAAAVHGRTDKIPLDVPTGSYVLPADVVSALGQGNTIAGAGVLNEVLRSAPYQAPAGPYGSGQDPARHGPGAPGVHPGTPPAPPANQESIGDVAGPEPPHMARGGDDRRAPIIAAGGEYIVTPAQVRWLGDGDMDEGYRRLDRFVVHTRDHLRKTLAKLPGPKKD